MALRHRGADRCVFDSPDGVKGFCAWNDSMFKLLNTGEPIDRLSICEACTNQSKLRSVSFVGSLGKESIELVKEAIRAYRRVNQDKLD